MPASVAPKEEKGDLLYCVRRTLHHADFSTFVFHPDHSFRRYGIMRIKSIENGLREIFNKLRRIEDLAEKTNNQELLDIFAEEIKIFLVHD